MRLYFSDEFENDLENKYIAILNIDDGYKTFPILNHFETNFSDYAECKYMKFDTFENKDIISINVLHFGDAHFKFYKIIIYYDNDKCLFFCENYDELSKIINDVYTIKWQDDIGMFIFDVINKLSNLDVTFLTNMEEEALEIEKALITYKNKNVVNKIISMKKKLLNLKQFYEQYLYILSNIKENDKNIYSDKTIKSFKILENKLEKYYNNVINIRDYVTQVREAYQSAIDINLNTSMRLFTVITTIFLPLTLIVGWYGMNVKMPEYDFAYSYHIIILISILFILSGVIYFKKNDWF